MGGVLEGTKALLFCGFFLPPSIPPPPHPPSPSQPLTLDRRETRSESTELGKSLSLWLSFRFFFDPQLLTNCKQLP